VKLLFESIRPIDKLAPAPGFYERVRSHIEQVSSHSIWMPLVYPHFPKRFVAACLGASLVLLGYTVAAEWSSLNPDHGAGSRAPEAVSHATFDTRLQRDVVLMQIATYSRPN
jgi:hypothetical protein